MCPVLILVKLGCLFLRVLVLSARENEQECIGRNRNVSCELYVLSRVHRLPKVQVSGGSGGANHRKRRKVKCAATPLKD
eukprot:g51872.t1